MGKVPNSEQLWAESLYQTFYEQKKNLNIIMLYGSYNVLIYFYFLNSTYYVIKNSLLVKSSYCRNITLIEKTNVHFDQKCSLYLLFSSNILKVSTTLEPDLYIIIFIRSYLRVLRTNDENNLVNA